ncbi:CheR family methyltransferase [Pedobacter sp.]|jgi:two-component system CheB/CheR fusion protein|uniref:CheR family methyltransferase n=1 Tax=Pedobacter sp. TaxID=1411316 RepID=UPI002C3AD5F6|nr:CheR family methyltransferase [Pedobacter sp.]HWW39817.1 CheR family methyltransferase [Pedobacter sp.]
MKAQEPEQTNTDEENILAIIDLIQQQSPLDFSGYKPSTIIRRTQRKAAKHHLKTLSAYLEFLKVNPDEIKDLCKEFMISVTAFFRDPEAFEYLQTTVLPEIISNLQPEEELKMWVAGCATGEEVYSLAILIAEILEQQGKRISVKLFATDIDNHALSHASKGIYKASVIGSTVSAERLERYFIKDEEHYKIKPALRKMVIFALHDLVKNPPYCNMHLISCRNLLIYLNPSLQKKIFTMLQFGLKKDGFLFLGSSENPAPILHSLHVENKIWKIYKNLETKKESRFDNFLLPERPDVKRRPVPYPSEDLKISSNAIDKAMHTALAGEINYLVVCTDEEGQVLKSYGDTSKYLLQKSFNSDLLELMPKPIAIAFNILRKTALTTNKKAVLKSIQVKSISSNLTINLSVSPLSIKRGAERLLIVTFTEQYPESLSPDSSDLVFDHQIHQQEYILNMEEEIKELKEKLQTAYFQLDANNENLQSFNEELLSANEEMQSTNEEMQSVNEELDAINSDYKLKNKELLEINDDLNNYFRSNINGQIFINNDLQLMRFSPGTITNLNLQESDLGKPLTCLSTHFKLEDILNDVKNVIVNGDVIYREIQSSDGKWYHIQTMPYIQQITLQRNGAIITFNDVTELKKIQLELDKKNKCLLRINADLDNFVHTASHDLLAPLANIETSIMLMNQELTDSGQKELLAIVNTSISTFRTLVGDIAIIAKLENDTLPMEKIDIAGLIMNIEWSLADRIKKSGALIVVDLQTKFIYFSKKNLRSILYNLMSNSIKFAKNLTPVIFVSSRVYENEIIISVQDNGRGIPKDQHEKIFNIYGRVHQDVEGSGIGLFLARKIVHAANGDIEVESTPEVGSKFSIRLPIISV